jgi:acetoacetyl-CoA synthetase
LTSAMKAHGIKKEDQIAIVASNSVDVLKVFLATVALSALFSSSSTDIRTKRILDKLLQVELKV